MNEFIDTRVSNLERSFHELDKNNALLSGEVKNLTHTIGILAKTMDRVSDELAIILPKIHVSQQWEGMFRNAIFFFIGLIISGMVGVVIHYYMK